MGAFVCTEQLFRTYYILFFMSGMVSIVIYMQKWNMFQCARTARCVEDNEGEIN